MVPINHVFVTSEMSFGKVAAAVEAQLGKFDASVYGRLKGGTDPETVRAQLEGMVGPSGFMLFSINDHGALLRLAGLTKNAIQYVLGNPLFAFQMTQHDLRASLYAPLRLLLYTDAQGRTCFEYDTPSSQFGQFGNPRVNEVAAMLDEKLERLVANAIK
jgi:uncharacterized protein (DUF302 family)